MASIKPHVPVTPFQKRAGMVLLFLLVSRLLAMWLMPLNDSTEARYGEIARIMLETGDWITPMQSVGVPFWAKPPLSTWTSASSMWLFGINAFAARLPSLLLSLGTLWLVWDVAKQRSGSHAALISLLVLAGSLFFFLDATTVMTDPALLFCTTLSLIAFWRAVVNPQKTWGHVFFAGLGLGLLAKGPIALVLVGMPIFVWVLMHHRWRAIWRSLPWITGGLLMVLIAVPWYVLAEIKTPGFIHYFIIGEHFHRFLDPGWGGDKYGFAHKAHYGMIWVYAVLGFLPWSVLGVIGLTRHVRKWPLLFKDNDGWVAYLLACIFMPIIFFTCSGNIIYPYVFPILPFLALLFSDVLIRMDGKESTAKTETRLLSLASISGVIFLMVTALFVFKPEWVAKSQYRVVAAYQKAASSKESRLVYWAPKTDFSAQFYSAGRAMATLDATELGHLLSNAVDNYVVIRSNQYTTIPDDLKAHLMPMITIKALKDTLTLYRSDPYSYFNG
ncbi:MAG TPA: dolichyl-phosphate-mannose--protein mannosyltransferase [Legionella sp.]|nr:dolichyl-phosphate-mannose--protein mannosyltransferase [Legionella sp.]